MTLEVLLLMPASHRGAVFTDTSLRRLHRIGTVEIDDGPVDLTRPDVRERLARAEVVVTGTGTGKLDAAVLDAAPSLRAVVHTAGTLRPIVDLDVYDRGILLSSQAAANALPVAEYTLAMILLELKGVRIVEDEYAAARGAIEVDELLAHRGAYGRTVGVVAASAIGRRVIELLRPFDVHVLVSDPFLSSEDAERLGAELVDLPTLLARSDLVSLHAPLLPTTQGMVGAAELATMRDGTVFINTARGALVDQDALLEELRRGRLRAVIDVTDPEVPDSDSPIWDTPNLVLTPHVAGSRGLELRRIGERAVDEIERLAVGADLRYGVSRARYATNA